MLLTIGAMVLLGTVVLTTNRAINDSGQVLLKSNYGLEGVAVATSVIERAQNLAFDQYSKDSTWVFSLAALTPPNQLGQESSTGDTLDDFDDFNGQPGGSGRTETDSVSAGVCMVLTRVFYVYRDGSGNFVPSTQATWSKMLDVRVWNTMDPSDTVHMSTIYSYWYFR